MIPNFRKSGPKVYKPEYCDDLIKYMSQGKSNLELAAKLGITEKTFYDWRKRFPDFGDAYDLGDPLRFAALMEKADEMFLLNDKGYKHFLKKISHMYKDYSPDAPLSSTTNNIQIGNVNMVEYQAMNEGQLFNILQTKMAQLKPIEHSQDVIEGEVLKIESTDHDE